MGVTQQIRTLDCRDLIGEIAKSTYKEQIIDLSTKGAIGSFSLQLITTGSGTFKIELYVTNEKAPTNWIEDGRGDIASSQTQGSAVHDMTPTALSRWIKIRITETGGSASIVVATAMLAMV